MGNIMDEKPKKTKKAPRIKHKKLIILFSAILIVGLVFVIKAFSAKHYALAEETESFEIERPTSGNPLDYSGKDNAAIVNWVIRHTDEFKTVTTGSVTAKVAVINYNQDIHNTRIVTTDGCYIETISNSSLVKVHEEKYLKGDEVVIRKNGQDKYQTITKDLFLEKYGWHPTEFQAYILNEQSILEATIEEADGNYKLNLTLDPVVSAPKKQKETKTIGGAKDYPGYKKTNLVVTLDKNWVPLQVDTDEVYDIGMPGLGDITCKGKMVEVFEYGHFDIPDKEKFKENLGKASDVIEEGDKDVIGYLQEIFGPLIQGTMNDFKITVDGLDTKMEGKLNLKLESSGITANVKLDDIYVSYQGDDLYLKLGNNKYKISINDVKAKMPSDGSSQTLDLDLILSQVSKSIIEKTDSSVKITMNLELMGIKAKVIINATLVEDLYRFDSVYATLDIFGTVIDLSMLEDEVYTYPVTDSTYKDINDMLFIVDEAKALMNKPVEIKLNTTVSNHKLAGTVIYDNGLASGNIIVDDKYEANVYYENKMIFITVGNLNFKFNIDDLSKLTDTNINLASDVKVNIKDVLDLIKTIEINVLSKKEFSIGCNVSKFTDKLNKVEVKVSKTDALNVRMDAYNLDVHIKATNSKVTRKPSIAYINIVDLKWTMDDIMKALEFEAYSFDLDLVYKGLKVNGNIYLDKNLTIDGLINLKYQDYEFKDIRLTYKDNLIYVSYNNIKLSFEFDDVKDLVIRILDFLDIELKEIDVNELIDLAYEKLYLNGSSNSVDLSINLESLLTLISNTNITIHKGLVIDINTFDISANIKVSEASIKDITLDSDYINYDSIKWLVDDVFSVLEYNAYGINLDVEYKDIKANGAIYLNKDLEVEAILNVSYSGLNFNDIKLVYKNKDIYLSYGLMSIKINISDIKTIIEEINTVFNLNISSEANITFDTKAIINRLLEQFKLNVSEDSISMNLDLSSISEILSNVEVNIEKGLKLSVNTTDIKLSASLTNEEYKEVEMPEAIIDKDKVLLLIEYANQLKEVVEKWRYNIGFELHVNGYDVYAKANIVTFKPEKGLSLYGKVILVKGDKKFYIEASIINNVAYLMFSQTVNGFNKNNPIASTTSQYIKFKIDFNELIDTAEYAMDSLGIENDTIKMAIAYLGTIVNTNGDFDDLFTELKDKVKSIDLSMVNDMFDLSKIFLDVDTDKLTITLGDNSEGDLQVLEVFREDGQIKGINVGDFEINNDILNGHFELLPDEDISDANYNGCLDLNGIGNLIKAALNNYKVGEIAFEGNAKMSIFGIGLATVKLEVKLDFDYNGKLRGYIYVHTPYLLLATNNETDAYIYIEDDMIYMKRVAHPVLIGSDKTETRKMSLSRFGTTAKEQVVWIFNFGSLVANAILDAEAVDIKIEEVLRSYSGKNGTYEVGLNGDNLTGSSAFGEIDLTLKTKKVNEALYIDSANVTCDIASVLGLDLNVTFDEKPISWSFFPSVSSLSSYSAY